MRIQLSSEEADTIEVHKIQHNATILTTFKYMVIFI